MKVENSSDHIRPSPRAVAPSVEALSRPSASDRHLEVKAKGTGIAISGILYKWVNYGKGWRPRWFVLQDGVLSFYKIHGPDKVMGPPEEEENEIQKVIIGRESSRRRRIYRQLNGSFQFPRQAVGEIHLKVSSVRESRSDHKRFSIFTGTKRVHLRAETREDRGTWIKCLQDAKDMFPRISNSELMAPLDNVVVSTDKLRQRLMKEGVAEAAIQDSEQIMRNEFSVLLSQLARLKQKHLQLIDTLRRLTKHNGASASASASTSQICHSSTIAMEHNSAPSSTFHSPRNSFSGLHL